MPNKQGDWKLDHPCPHDLSFCGQRCNLILVLLCKANLEHKEIRASVWLKPPISMLLTLVFMFYIPDLALCDKESIYSSSEGSLEEH